MGLKRKRSAVDFSPASSSGASFAPSSRGSQSPTPTPVGFRAAMDVGGPHLGDCILGLNAAAGLSATDLGSRTRKRFRDNRPDERVIHENTLNKLFAAQRQQHHRNHHAPPQVSPPPPSSHKNHHQTSSPPDPTPAPVQRSTLHAFWSIPCAPSRLSRYAPQHQFPVGEAPVCEDCDAQLSSDDGMDINMGGGDGAFV
ncbi:hypothetical protein BDY21DRAFT_372285 [Lineolata rhizophorae]|uniref:Uncharacterized protein n=1 Tax=Lineolata rhizophorae TaxID=578093 RepID=A0A6A6NYM1_9PEZI|nr:hypothetical protein BDY21DRAFT_372285 [Lineolata rhizophorae]